MCGIAGIIQKEGPRQEDRVRGMTDRLRHRGPDGTGVWSEQGATLGHARLAIVDPAGGAQPMVDAKAAITFNGEIFGYADIRAGLAEYPFTTASDTEIILALYRKYGKNLLRYLPGQFAFALWDRNERTLLCARDRFGEKPFYYAVGDGGEFVFGSELKAVLASGLVRPQFDPESLAHYLKHLYVHPTRTIYRNIHVLPPAHRLLWENGIIRVERYWDLPETNASLSLSEAAENLRLLLDRSVKEQLIADVPVGAFLSGGLDSSTIVALASRHTSHLKTFSFRFDADRDETIFARDIAARYGTDHVELAPEEHDLGALLERMQDVYDEPFADSSNIPTYLLSEAARKHVKAVLTGDGGDELFGGYAHWYQPLLAMQATSKKPSLLAVARLYLQKRMGTIGNAAYLGPRFRQKFSSLLDAHANQDVAFTDGQLGNLLGRPLPPRPSEVPSQTIDDVLREDLRNYLPGDILVKIDRASMAHGLELRAPFLGRAFAEFAVTIPWELKLSGEGDKLIFREAFEELWTERVRSRGKQGFGAPVSKWLSLPSVAKLADLLRDPRARLYSLIPFDTAARYTSASDQRTWTLLVLALWAESHEFSL